MNNHLLFPSTRQRSCVLLAAILEVVVALVFGVALWIQAGFVQYRSVDVLTANIMSGNIIVQAQNGSEDPRRLSEKLASDIIGSSVGSIITIAVMLVVAEFVLATLIVLCVRRGTMSRGSG